MKEIRHLREDCGCAQSRLPATRLTLSPSWKGRLVPQPWCRLRWEDGRGFVAGDCQGPLVVPSFPYLSSHKRMTEIMKAQVR